MCINIQTKKNPAFQAKPNQTYMISYPCGKCPLCLRKYLSQWLFRIEKEMQQSNNTKFITLTYNDENLPSNQSVSKRDIQLFFKRIRKHLSTYQTKENKPLRYIAVSEYGTKGTQRPHYHILLFNSPEHQTIESVWNKGFITTSEATPRRIKYIFKYVHKKNDVPPGRIPNFKLQSTKIGANYLTPQMIEYHNRQIENCYIVKPDGNKLSIPKYYKKHLFSEEKALKVTKYQQQRINALEDSQIAQLMNRFRTTENIAYSKWLNSKNNTTFDPTKKQKL